MLLLSFAAQDPSSQLAASFLLLVQSSCIQKWFQASNESQTLPSDPPLLCSSFAAASSSLKTPALQPCGKLRRERRQQGTSEAVGGVQAGGLQPSGDLWRCQPKLCNVGDGSPCFEHVQQRRKCLSINNMFVVCLLAPCPPPQKRCLVSTICHLSSCSHSRHRLCCFADLPSTAARPRFKWRPRLSLLMLSPLSDPADSTSSSVPLLPVDFVHLVGTNTFSIHCKTHYSKNWTILTSHLHFEEVEEYLSNSVSFL